MHGKDGWYVGSAQEHYRCVRVYIPETGQERICDTVKFIPGSIPIPKVSTKDYLLQAEKDIVILLKYPQKLELPPHPDLELNDAIRSTAQLLQRAAEKPQLPPHKQRFPKVQKNTTPPTTKNLTHVPSTRQPDIIEDEEDTGHTTPVPRVLAHVFHPRVEDKPSSTPTIPSFPFPPYI